MRYIQQRVCQSSKQTKTSNPPDEHILSPKIGCWVWAMHAVKFPQVPLRSLAYQNIDWWRVAQHCSTRIQALQSIPWYIILLDHSYFFSKDDCGNPNRSARMTCFIHFKKNALDLNPQLSELMLEYRRRYHIDEYQNSFQPLISCRHH